MLIISAPEADFVAGGDSAMMPAIMDENRPNPTRRHARRALAVALVALTAFGAWYFWKLVLTKNFGQIVPGQVYRSAQPTGGHVRRWAQEYGIRTIINLRGESSLPFYLPEHIAAAESGVRVVDISLSAQSPPPAPQIRRLIHALETAERPILIHCRAGADRTGTAAVIAAMALGGEDYDSARKHLTLNHLHVGVGKVRIQQLLRRYEAYCRTNDLPTADWEQFRHWAMNRYHPGFYRLEIRPAHASLRARPGELVKLPVDIRNDSSEVIPGGKKAMTFTLSAFTGSAIDEKPDAELGSRVVLPDRDLAPGDSVRVNYVLEVPRQPGRYDVHFDVIHEKHSWFSRQGSPVATIELIVSAEAAEDDGELASTSRETRRQSPPAGADNPAEGALEPAGGASSTR